MIRTEKLNYRDDGQDFGGIIVFDDAVSTPRPGVLVWPDATGLTANTVKRAEMLAGLGYVALAADPYGENKVAADFSEAKELADPLLEDRRTLRRRCHAALEQLAGHRLVDRTRVAAIGYCLGGTFVLEMARNGENLRGVVCFHGQLDTPMPASAGMMKAKVLVCNGSEDPVVPESQVRDFQSEMRSAEADWQIVTYGNTYHSFTDWSADGSLFYASLYNEQSDQRSWGAMKYFLREVFEGM